MKRPCFTLLELLVAIAIIALLVALSISVLRGSKQRAKTILCMSHIRQLTVGLTMYEEDNQTFPYSFHDTFEPPPGGFPGSAAYDRRGWWWFHLMQGYAGTDGAIFCCPSKSLGHSRLKDCILYGNYGVNLSICRNPDDSQSRGEEFAGTPLAGDEIPQPSRTLLIVDSGYSIISWWHATDVPPPIPATSPGEATAYVPGLEINKDRKLLPGQEQDAVDGRHPNKTVNVGFADGHVNTAKAKDLSVEKAAERYANRAPLWSPK